MVSKNNVQVKDRYSTKQVPHYGIRKLSVGVASILLGTTFYMGMNGNVVHADTVNGQDSETPGSQVANSDSNNGSTSNSDANVDKTAFGDKHVVGSSAEASVNNEVNVKPQVTEITNDSHGQSATNAAKSDVDANAQSDAANVKPDTKTPSNETNSAIATETSPVPMSPLASSSSQGIVTVPVEGDASNKSNSQGQPSFATDITQTKLSHRPVMRLAAVPTTNSDELIVGKDVTISDFSVTVAEGKNEFENAHANIKFTMHADDPSALAGKRLTIRVDTKVWDGFYSSEQQDSNPATVSYQGHVIGTLSYGYPFYFVYITFNDDVKNYTKIDVQSDLVVAGTSQRGIPYRTSLYTSTQAKDGQTYYLTNDVTIGQQKYSSNLPSVIHYHALDSEFVSSVTDVTTTSYTQRDSELYAGTFYKTPNGIYYSKSSIYGGNNLYSEQSGQSGYLEEPSINVGTDIVTDRTQSYTATSDIDQTKLSPAPGSKLVPTKSYYLTKYYWDDENLLSNTRDVYVDDSQTYSTTVTADATVIKNGVIFNKLNGQSLATRIVNVEGMNSHSIYSRNTNYIDYDGKLYFTPALFKQLQAVAESDQNLTEAINTVKTTGMNAEIKLAKPIDTGLKATIKTSDGKTKEVSLLIDTIDYVITTSSTAPKGAMLVAAQGKTAKVYHSGDQNIPSVVDQSQLTKTITRMINVHEPGKSVTTIKQTVVLTQSVSVVDGKDVTYNGDWKVQGDSQWASYDVPSVPGYTVSQSRVAQQAVTDETQDQTVDITYTGNEHQINVEYVDNATGQVVKTDHMSGKTGQTVSITPHVPDGWELVSGQSVPSEVTLGADGAPVTVIKVQPQERSVAVKFVDDQSYDFDTSDHKAQVGQAITVTGRDGDTVNLNLTVPDKYQLADGQQLPTTYTFAKGSGDLRIHLVHKVVQLEATIDVKLDLMTAVRIYSNHEMPLTVTQDQWKQIEAESKYVDIPGELTPSVKAGTLTGHVDYDLVYGNVVSFGDDWTSLNLGGQTYQLPNGDEVVNGVMAFSGDYPWGKTLKEFFLKDNTNTDSDYANRPWHGYLSVNTTNNNEDIRRIGLQAGLVGDEFNALAKATGDRAATGIEMANKTIDLSWLQHDVGLSLPEINEQDGQVKYHTSLDAAGVYIPYVEKTVTRTIKVKTPDGETTTVKQTATLAKQVDLGKDAHPAWTTGEWVSYDVPTIPGYTASQSQVVKETVTGTTKDQTVNVTYTPNAQKLNVKFIDDTTGQVLKTVVKTGVTNANSGYNTQSDIHSYEGQHYVLVSDSSNGANLVFDNNDSTDQAYEVHLKHGTHQIDEHHTITQTVHYIATDHASVSDDHTVSVQFDRDGYHDEVTGDDHWNAWKQGDTQTFAEVPTPKKAGYTPDKSLVLATVVHPLDHNQTIDVMYTPDTQKVIVTFIDDTDGGKTLKTVTKTGPTNSSVAYTTGDDINTYKGQHYVLVSDQTHGQSITFDTDTNTDQRYEVHLKHGMHQIDDHRTITETVHYKMADGTTAPSDHTAKAEFNRDGFNDEVTGTDHWNAWTPSTTHQFDVVHSPVVKGYTPDADQIIAMTVNPDSKNIDRTVTYTPNVQIAHVKYIDDTDHKVLTQDDLNGRTGETSGYHTADRITEFKGQHYDLVSDNYPTDGMTFDNNDHADQIYEVHFKHATRTDEQDVQVPRTIKYVYQNGQPAQPDYTDALRFHETKVVDLVDGHTVSDDWTSVQDFKTIKTPVIQGYTPDHASVSNAGIAHDHPAIVETVTYNPDAQKAVVKYIDDTTGEQLEAKDLTGVSDQSTGYNTKSTIDGYVARHYDLVSDGTHGETITFDHDDGADQAYEVHFKHGTEPANESRVKKITVHYQYADGLARSGKAADDKTVTNLTFKRTGTHDLVTDKIAWNAWDHADQTFSAINSPAIQGYTPDRTVVDNVKVNPDSHDLTEVTVTYNADSQKLSVDFIDDTTGKTLKTVDKIGYSDESADYNTKADIQDLISKHYDLTSDQTNGENLVFDHDDDADQHYEVHLIHHTHQINEQHTITETVHYRYADGLARSGEAADDFNANALKFSRNGFNDEVTGVDHWNAWTPAAQQTFVAVQTPVIEGYTPDQSEIGVINVFPTSQNIEKTVTYHADAQKLAVNFIDDVTGQTLKTVTKTGYSDESAGYNTKADIQIFVGQHYDLVSDVTKGVELVFDHDDSVDQVYDVHLIHHLTPISDHQVVNETIHYVYADGLARTGKAADDHVAAPLEFNRNGKHDDVTGTDAWDAWIPGSASFAAVQSPVIEGYTSDQSQIDVIPVNANSQDIVKTVTYSADQQKMTIDFIDDTDNGKVLKTVIKTGGSDEAVGYNTKADLQTFADSHYKLDHDTSNGANLVFDHDDAVDQHYEVHLTHETAPISEATSTNQVIHYQLADGTPVAKDYTAKVDFSRNGFKDLVTNADHWNAWIPNAIQTFDAVVSPVKAGYTPDHSQVDAVTVEPHHADLETTVTYSPDAQKAAVKYIDDVTGKTLQTKEMTGVSDETSTYTTASTIKQYVGQHYKLVSDQTNGKPVVFDHDNGSDQIFEVHLTHTYQQVSQEHQVHQTIHYQYANGKQARPDYTAKALAFSRTGTQDLVTENIQWNAWTPDQVFAAVDTPAVNGYTPDVQTIAPVKVGHDSKDIEQTVIYHADDQTILVNYIDDDTHSTLKTDSIIGKTAQTSDYTTKKSLDQCKGQHYDVVSDDTHGDSLTFDSDSTKVQIYNVHLKHQHQAANDKATVHQTVHYVYQDGKQAAKDHTATPIEFTRTGDTDLVTGQTTWNAWTPADGTFVAVLSPVIAGYTPSQAMINHVSVHPGDKDLDTTVTYVPDRQMIVVNYIDQTTGKTLKTDTLNGHSDQTSGYTTKSQIDSYLGQHYKLISDATNGKILTFDHDDQATQTYDVVLGHQTEAAHRTHEVQETVDYVYADGSQAAKSFTAQPLVFSQTGVHDLVTNVTDWNGEWTKPQVFAAVESPKITGFTASKPSVKAVEVNHQSGDVHELVIYAANAQTAQIKYIDDVTGNVLETDGASGHFNESIVFSHNVNDQINKFKQAHYKLVSNNFAGQKYQADNAKNVYEVHLIHERQNVHATDTVTETVKFQYADGSQAQPTKIQAVNFGRDGIKDLVTGATVWMPVDPQTIGAVDVPAITGYTSDVQNVPAATVNFGDADITKVVTYKANDQLAGIKYIDDTTGKTLDTEAASGKFGTKIEFMNDPSSMIQKFEGQGYKLVSDNFKSQDYQADDSKNQFEVHFKHGMKNVSRTSTIARTINYVDQKTGKEVHQPVIQTLTITENGVTDLVTGKTTWETPSDQQFVKVESPKVDGYENPDILVVDAETAKFGDGDQTVTVHYQKVEIPVTSDTSKAPSDSSTPSAPSTQNELNISTMPMHTPIQVGSQNVNGQQTINNGGESQLPQTGNQDNHQAGLVGLVSVIFAGLLGFGKRRKKND